MSLCICGASRKGPPDRNQLIQSCQEMTCGVLRWTVLRYSVLTFVMLCCTGRAPSRHLVIRAADPNSERTGGEDTKGVVPGLAQWPPKPITEHGQPKPEDDPKNFAAECVLHDWLVA